MESNELTKLFEDTFRAGDESKTKSLLQIYGPDVKLQNDGTPFHYAAAVCNNPTVFNVLLAAGSDIHAVDMYGQTLLHFATMHDNNIGLRWLLEQQLDPNVSSYDFTTPLHYAAYENAKGTELLLTYGAYPDGASPECSEAPLHNAAQSSAACTRILLESGANINVKDKNGQSPIYYAFGWALAEPPHLPIVEIVKVFLEYKDQLLLEDDLKFKNALNRFKVSQNIR